MSVLEIHKYPSRVLKQKASDVREISGRTARMLHDMVDTMYVANGIGLAAPQIGVLERVIVVDTDTLEVTTRQRRYTRTGEHSWAVDEDTSVMVFEVDEHGLPLDIPGQSRRVR